MKAALLCLLPGLGAVLAAAAADLPPDALGAPVVELIVTHQAFDPFFPWQREQPRVRTGYGVHVGEGRVLTTEALLRNGTLVEMRRARSGQKTELQVEISDAQLNLGLLKLPGPADLPAVSPAEGVSRGDTVFITQFDATRQVQTGQGDIDQIAVAPLPAAPFSVLTLSVRSDLKIRGHGAAVTTRDGRLAGLVMRYHGDSRIADVIACPVVSRFIEDVDAPPYDGPASAGFSWSSLVDPVKRAYLGLVDHAGGILVRRCLPGTGAARALRAGDVILRWDGRDIDDLGYYEDPVFQRLSLPYLIKGRRRPGDRVPVVVVRDGVRRTAEVELAHYPDTANLIPENTAGAQPDYLVDGGCILRELTGRYLRAHGKNWHETVDSRLVHLYLTRRNTPEQPQERIVLLSSVLADPVNIGYQRFRDQIVTGVNGESVTSMTDVFSIVDRDGGLERLSLRSVGVDLVLAKAERAIANDRLARQYRISAMHHRTGGATEGEH